MLGGRPREGLAQDGVQVSLGSYEGTQRTMHPPLQRCLLGTSYSTSYSASLKATEMCSLAVLEARVLREVSAGPRSFGT